MRRRVVPGAVHSNAAVAAVGARAAAFVERQVVKLGQRGLPFVVVDVLLWDVCVCVCVCV